MHSWGHDVTESAQHDLDRLLNAGLRVAQARLADAAYFEPAALVLSKDDRILEIDQDRSGLGKHPEADEVIRNAVRHLRQVRGEVRSTALVINTRLARERSDAVEVRVEHEDGPAAVVLVPYKRATFGGRTEFGTLAGFVGARTVWA